jgi:hypothetical protein
VVGSGYDPVAQNRAVDDDFAISRHQRPEPRRRT